MILLDTHAFLWWLNGDPRLPGAQRKLIGTPGTDVYVSAATGWEITTKYRLGKLPGAADVAADVSAAVGTQGFQALPITLAHAQRAGGLRGPLRDPFDRMLIAQCLVESIPIISLDKAFDAYGVERLWG